MIHRRDFLTLTGGALLWPAAHALADGHEAKTGDPAVQAALAKSGFVYVSPLLADGSESTCHGEVWFGHFDGAAVLITGATTWKARALARGLDRARVWVGDHGRWKQLVARNEAFRKAPHFDARTRLAVYETKYPDEIASWRDKMRSGCRRGSRWLIRYAPA